MKYLIPYLQDDQKAADDLRQLRWPDGVRCPRCGSAAVESREQCDNGLQRFTCVPCAARLGQLFAMFTDWTSSIFEESKGSVLDVEMNQIGRASCRETGEMQVGGVSV